MGQKVHPVGFRLGITKDWQSRWYADKHYTEMLQEDLRIRNVIASKYKDDDIARVEIERTSNQVTVTVHTSRPGIVIGRGGQRVDETRSLLEKIAGKRVRLNIQEVSQPELDACLVARSIAQQMERRISHRRAMKQAIFRAMERGALGIKIICAGRVGSSEYARTEKLHEGRVPLHTLRADIDYATATAHTSLGTIGVKVYIYKGDIIPEYEKFEADAATAPSNKGPLKTEEKAEGVIVNAKAVELVGATDKLVELAISEEHGSSKDVAPVDGKDKSVVEGLASKSRPKARTRAKSVSTTPEIKVEKEEKPKTRGKAKDKSKTGVGESSDIGATAVIPDVVISEKEQKESKPKSKAKTKVDAEKESGKD